jgi:hypothetical protein
MLNVILLGITSLLTDASTEMVCPLIPLYLSVRLGAGPAIIGLFCIYGLYCAFTEDHEKAVVAEMTLEEPAEPCLVYIPPWSVSEFFRHRCPADYSGKF